MIRKLILALLLTLGAVSVSAQPSEPPQLRQVASTMQAALARNTAQDCNEFTSRFLAAVNDPHWGHVGKTRGEGQFVVAGLGSRVGRDGATYSITGVSHDAAYYCANLDNRGGCNYGSGDWQVDLLGNGNDGDTPLGSAARPQWNVIPQEFYRPNNPWIGVTSGTVPSPTPVPVPTPTPNPVDLSAITAALARLESAVAALADSQRATQSAVSEVDSKVTSIAVRVENLLVGTDFIARQLVAPPEYKGAVLGFGVTLRPVVQRPSTQ